MSPAKHGKHWRFIPLLSTEQNAVLNTGTFGFLTYSISLNHHWYHTKCTHTCKKQEKIVIYIKRQFDCKFVNFIIYSNTNML